MHDVVEGIILLLTLFNGVLLVLTLVAMSELVRKVDGMRSAPMPAGDQAKPLPPGTTWVPSVGEQARKEKLLAGQGDQRKWQVPQRRDSRFGLGL